MRVGKEHLQTWIIEALSTSQGHGTIVQISKFIWDRHEQDLRDSGDLFYTWQYDLRWAANSLRRNNFLCSAEISPAGIWELA